MGGGSFIKPELTDLGRHLDRLLERRSEELAKANMLVNAEAGRTGSLGNSRLIFVRHDRLRPIFELGLFDALVILDRFHREHGYDLDTLIEQAMPKLEKYTDRAVAHFKPPPSAAAFRHSVSPKVVAQYEAEFRQLAMDGIRACPRSSCC